MTIFRTVMAFFKVETKNTFVYRGMMVLWFMGWFLSFLTMVYLWRSADTSGLIGGYTVNQLVTYYFVGMVVWQFAGWFTFSVAARHIRDGEVIHFIIKPISFHWYRFGAELAWHTVNVLLFTGFMAGVYWLFQDFVMIGISLKTGVLFGVSFAVASLVTFEFNLWMATSAFWLTRYAGLESLYWLVLTLLGGMVVPLNFFSAAWQPVVRFLPFRFMYAFPIEIYLGQLNPDQLISSFLVGVVWIGVFYSLFCLFWQKGLRLYTGFGQ